MEQEQVLAMRVMLNFIANWGIIDWNKVEWPNAKDHLNIKLKSMWAESGYNTSTMLRFMLDLDQKNFEYLCGVIFDKWPRG